MQLKRAVVCAALILFFAVSFVSVQFILSERIFDSIYVSSEIQTYYATTDNLPIEPIGSTPSVNVSKSDIMDESGTVDIDNSEKEEIRESENHESPKEPNTPSLPFHPVGIPFNRSNWYRLFKHYQDVQYNASMYSSQGSLDSAMQSDAPWSVLSERMMYIKEGCIDIRHHRLLVMNSSSVNTLQHFNLRTPEANQTFLPMASFPHYHFYQVDASSRLPPSSDLTWVFSTPPRSSSECIDSFRTYFPLFIESIEFSLQKEVRASSPFSVALHCRSSLLPRQSAQHVLETPLRSRSRCLANQSDSSLREIAATAVRSARLLLLSQYRRNK